jgi:hypothetical protein
MTRLLISLKNQLTPDPQFHIYRDLFNRKTEMKYPSKWVTEIYIPVLSKIIPVKAYIPLLQNPAITKDATATDAIEPAKIKKPVIKVHRTKKILPHKTTEEDLQNFNLFLTLAKPI